jgi:hypothetical protein
VDDPKTNKPKKKKKKGYLPLFVMSSYLKKNRFIIYKAERTALRLLLSLALHIGVPTRLD